MKRYAVLLLLALLAASAVSPCAVRGTPVPDLLRRADLEEKDYEHRRAQALYETALAWEPRHFKALCGLAGAHAALGEYPRAEALYEEAMKVAPDRPEPARGMGSMAGRLDRKDEARRWYVIALEKDPENPKSLAGLARVEIEEDEFEKADELLRKAEAKAPRAVAVLSTRSEWHFRQRKKGSMTAATKLLREILEEDPRHLATHQRLATGFLEEDRKPYRPSRGSKQYEDEVKAARELYEKTALAEADAAFARLDTESAEDGRPAFYRGLVAIRRGRPREAIPHLWRAVEKEPDHYLFRNALTYAYRMKIAGQRAEHGGGPGGVDRITPLAAELAVAEVPGIEKIARGYDRLLPGERKVILRAAAPLARYMPALKRAGAFFDILGFEEGVCDARERGWLWSRRTHDGRWYGAIRGVGGRQAATGIEQVLEASELRYDTFAHEFAHQVHDFGLQAGDRAVIKRLYEEAKAADRCLDYYAAQNEKEYFAQGYEAFVSLVRHPFHGSVRRHTRFELKARDPVLYRFILRVTGASEPDPEVTRLAGKLAAFYEWAGDPVAVTQVRVFLGAILDPAASPR